VVWAAGVGSSKLGSALGVPLDRSGRVVVNPDLSVPGHPEVFVVGDLARYEEADGTVLPGIAPVAIQQGRHAARNIGRLVRGQATTRFRYRDNGTMATIGRGAAVAEIGPLKLSGFIAWLAWIFVHIFYLIGFRNRVQVMSDWAWEYLTWQRGARLITGPVGDNLNPPDEPLGEPRHDHAVEGAALEAVHTANDRTGPRNDGWKTGNPGPSDGE
jgi:NADH dehydrogenase